MDEFNTNMIIFLCVKLKIQTDSYELLLLFHLFELYQGLLVMDLHLVCKVEQKRKQTVFRGTNYKLITISITVFFSKNKLHLHLHDLA